MSSQTIASYCATVSTTSSYYKDYCLNRYETFWTWEHIAAIVGGVIGAIIVIASIVAYVKWRHDQNNVHPIIQPSQVHLQPYPNHIHPQTIHYQPNRLMPIVQHNNVQSPDRPQNSPQISLQGYPTTPVKPHLQQQNKLLQTTERFLKHTNLTRPNNNLNSAKENQVQPKQEVAKISQKRQDLMKYMFPPMPDIFYQTYIQYYQNLPIEHYPPPPPGFKYVPSNKNNIQLKQIRNQYNHLNDQEESNIMKKKKVKSTEKLPPLTKNLSQKNISKL